MAVQNPMVASPNAVQALNKPWVYNLLWNFLFPIAIAGGYAGLVVGSFFLSPGLAIFAGVLLGVPFLYFSLDQDVALVGLSYLVWAVTVVGAFLGIHAVSASVSITIYLTIITGFLVGIALAISMWGRTGSRKRVLAMDIFLIVSGVIAAFAFLPGLRPAGPGILLIALAVIILIVILIAWRLPTSLEWLIDFYNPEKGFGGMTFGEYTSFLGVIGALGAHAALSADAQGWYWLGHFGALLTFAAGASLFWRWLRFEDDPVPAYIALFLVFFTLLALGLTANYGAGFVGAVWGVFIVLAGIIFLLVGIFAATLRQKNNWGEPVPGQNATQTPITGFGRVWVFIFAALTFAVGGLFIAQLFLGNFFHVNAKYLAMAFGTAGLLCWVAAEIWNVYQKSQESWAQPLTYQEWEKNIWNIFGGFTLIFLTLSPLWMGDPPPPESTYIFMLGIAFGLLGTLRGIMAGMIKKYG